MQQFNLRIIFSFALLGVTAQLWIFVMQTGQSYNAITVHSARELKCDITKMKQDRARATSEWQLGKQKKFRAMFRVCFYLRFISEFSTRT